MTIDPMSVEVTMCSGETKIKQTKKIFLALIK